jgi:hypothetical protein
MFKAMGKSKIHKARQTFIEQQENRLANQTENC